MLSLCLAVGLLSAEPPEPNPVKLLETFRKEFVHITPGKGEFPASFTMGRSGGPDNEGPPHKVTFDYDFYMARYEVPQNLWEAVAGSNPSRWKGPRNSVEMLTYGEAVLFCRKATQLMRRAKLIEPDQEIRLPSEAEWEYAARAGSSTLFSFGDDVAELGQYGWFTGNAAGNDPPVGAKKPNAWDLYDFHGYLWEWCADPWHDTYEGAPNDGSVWQPAADDGPPYLNRYVLRSGSWRDKAGLLTSSFRAGASDSVRNDAVGLRCVLAKSKQ